jgi:hypothetical protein
MLTTKTHNAKIKKLKDEYEDQLQEQKRILNQMIQAMDVALIKYENGEHTRPSHIWPQQQR